MKRPTTRAYGHSAKLVNNEFRVCEGKEMVQAKGSHRIRRVALIVEMNIHATKIENFSQVIGMVTITSAFVYLRYWSSKMPAGGNSSQWL